MTKLNMYLNFDGNTEQAFDFYRSVFGGDFSVVMRYADMPANEGMAVPDTIGNKIMHISLPISEGYALMGSDKVAEFCGEDEDKTLVQGNAYNISITPESEAEAKRIFDAISEGGKVVMPLEPQFWGSLFGMVIDQFGVQWLVDYPLQ